MGLGLIDICDYIIFIPYKVKCDTSAFFEE